MLKTIDSHNNNENLRTLLDVGRDVELHRKNDFSSVFDLHQLHERGCKRFMIGTESNTDVSTSTHVSMITICGAGFEI